MATKGLSEASSSRSKSKYEVFLSFRGEDTRKNFTDHLYAALLRAGVNTFRDDDELARGKDISSELLKAIQESKASLLVFSKGYASSRWCLNELVNIMNCKNTVGQIVVPIFYHVDPSDVRNQTGSFAKAFAKHEEHFEADTEMIKRWRTALTEAADLSGWDLQNVADGHESKFIQKIVEDVLRKVNRIYLHVATHSVAIKSRVRRVMEFLSIGSKKVRIMGIYGMGGVGKTTIAKAVYNSVCDGFQFDGSSFLSDIKDNSKQPNGLASIQRQLLSDILNLKSVIIDHVDRGINLIQERLRYQRVFIVLDDVDDSTQLNSLVGDRKWFGLGSRIIVTTRDERLLTELEVDQRYKVEKLNPEESIQLFCWHAFRRPNPKDGYFQLSKSVVDHVQGLPLALEVLGSYLFKRSQLEWENVVEKLRQIPHDRIQKKLRISFDALDDQMKAIFLDIACFFIGMDKEYVMKILDGCGFFPVIGVSVLLERSLITIDQHNHKLKMHDLLRDMGREIVREISPNHTGKRSRVWLHQDVVNLLQTNMGTKAVEGLSLDVSARSEDVIVSTEAFAKMTNLRLLKINSVRCASGCYENFSKELRWLCWHTCPLQVLPPNLHLDNLAVLDLRFSNVKKVWKETKFLHKLKILDLSYSLHLAETPNFARLLSLERLQLEGCTSLIKVHQSIGTLERLVFLNLAECNKIRELPDSICNLRSLETLNLNGCSKLCSFPEHLGKLEALRNLFANGSAITQLPISFGLLKKLEDLSLAGCREELPSKSFFSFFSSWVSPKSEGSSTLLPATFSRLSSLTKLNLLNRNLSNKDISIDFGSFPLLDSLDLSGNKFCSLSVGISNHSRLRGLYLNDCKNLQSIQALPPELHWFKAERCTSIVEYPKLSNAPRNLLRFLITNCRQIMDIEGWDLPSFSLSRPYFNWTSGSGDFKSKNKYLEACFPAREVPDWCDYKATGSSSVLICMPLLASDERRCMVLWVVRGINEEYYYNGSSTRARLNILFRNKTKGCETFDRSFSFDAEMYDDHAWVTYLRYSIFEDINAGEGDEIEVSVEAQGRGLVKKWGIHLPIDRASQRHSMHDDARKCKKKHKVGLHLLKSSILLG
ncbi:TMV resistance protein N-like [Herrania umbratica]|uniref:TMV resistance protein N-like n=1 Tax=Herrania umbratica TaxID=108875 RepID=A0A6J1AT60_9ROSI|nr:TMV resistance protein N-like [Herrania umbratica]